MLKVFKYPEVPDQDKPDSGDLLFGIQDGKSVTPLPFYTNGNNSAIVSFTAVEFDQFRNEKSRISLDTTIIDVDVTNNIYNVDSLTDYTTALENGVYRFEFQNGSNLWQTEYFKVTDQDLIPGPAILKDGNTVKWFDYLENVTKDGGDLVSSWDNKTGIPGIIPGALLQATTLDRGKWFLSDGILFDGIRQSMQTAAFTFNQPEMVYIVFKQVTWTVNRRIFDGVNDLSMLVQNRIATPDIAMYAGSFSARDSNLILDTYSIGRFLYNSANSSLQINNNAQWNGNAGASNAGGFTLADNSAGSNVSNIQVKEIILRKIADTAGNQTDIYNYLANKYSI